MATSLNMTLDDMVRRSRNERARGQGRFRRGRGPGGAFSGGRAIGPVRRGPLAVNARSSSYSISKPSRRPRGLPWKHDLFEDSLRAAGISGIEVGTRLYVSNLDHGVTNEDIRELFSEIGELKRYAVHYDKNGRPSGSAEVVYLRRSDAFAALKRYNNVLLDGRPMRIEIVGANAEMSVSARVNVTGINGRKKRTVFMKPEVGQARGTTPMKRGPSHSYYGGMRNGRGGARGRGRGGGRGGARGRGRGHGRGAGTNMPLEKSADQLDKELDNYHAEAMNTS